MANLQVKNAIGETKELEATEPSPGVFRVIHAINSLPESIVGALTDAASATGSLMARLRAMATVLGIIGDAANVAGSIPAILRYLGTKPNVIFVTPTISTAVYAANELIADATEIPAALLDAAGGTTLKSVSIQDKGNQSAAFKIWIMAVSTSFGTINSAPNITAANQEVAKIQAIIDVAAEDYVSINGVAWAYRTFVAPIRVPAGTSLYFAIVNGAGTPDYVAAGDLVLGFGVAP